MKCELKVFYLLLIINLSNCAPHLKNDKREVIKYLKSYGYYHLITAEDGSEISHEQLKYSIRQLQAYGHIPVTGKIDEYTLALIKRPRCGVPDIPSGHKRHKRYALLSTKWEKNHLTWNFDSSNGNFYHESPKIRRLITEALNVWSRASVLTFSEVHNPESADIIISFEASYHPHIDSFDLGNSALAHGFGPGSGIGGDIHVREDLQWDFEVIFHEQPAGNGISFFAVILHEFGHTFGLHHSDDPTAVMYASYTTATGMLSSDDIEGIQHIYGVPEGYQDTTTNPTINAQSEDEHFQIPDKCDMSYDAIALIRNELFIFKSIYMWRPESNSEAIEIRKFWDLPKYVTHVDSVYENDDGLILFFFGRQIFAFNGMTLAYHSSLSHFGIDHRFEKIDAIFKWHFNQRTYIFSGNQYWRFNENYVDGNYPKDISSSWHDVYDIDTAFSDNDGLYFFKRISYYHLNPRTMYIDRMNPMSSSEKFMRCPLDRRKFKVSTRFGDGFDDVIDMGQNITKLLDEENIENLDEVIEDVATENSSDNLSNHFIAFPIFLISIVISRVVPLYCPL